MSKRKFIAILAVIYMLIFTASCRSMETADTAPVTTAAQVQEANTIASGGFAGVLYEDTRVTAASAAPIPGMTFTRTSALEAEDEPGADNRESTGETTEAPEERPGETETSVSAASTAGTTVNTAPDMVISETTAATTTQTTVSETAPTTSAAPETAADTTAAVLPVSAGSYSRNTYSALNHSYVKAVWISYIELSALYRKSEADFTKGFAQMLDNCVSLGINTVYVHVRAFGDAYYFSDLFPFTKQLSGTLGKRTDYDPLKIMVREAHDRDLSFHAWINPMRLCVASDMPSVPQEYTVGKWYNGAENGKYIVNVNGTYFLNPAYDEVRKLIGDGVREIVSRYNVDGIHIDDYFYPTMETFFDSDAYSKSGASGLDAFRIEKCSAMVREMYTAAHECGSALFGAAPQGNNYNNLHVLYANTKAWAKGGYIDYFAPQIYYGFENGAVPFASNVDEWSDIVAGTGIKLIPGLAVYKCGAEDKWAGTGRSEWQNTDTMLKRQKEYSDSAGCNGIALYSYNYLFSPSYTNTAIGNEISNLKPLLRN